MNKDITRKAIQLALLGFYAPHVLGAAENITPNTLSTLNECIKKDETEVLCDASNQNRPAFSSSPITYFSDQIDIRPENCESFYDDYLHFRRGMRIESALGTMTEFSSYRETVSTFPVIDFISGSRGHVVKSKDITSATYNKTTLNGSLYDSILKDALDINKRVFDEINDKGYLSATTKGSTTIIRKGEIQNITLHIIIQAGMTSDYHVSQIRKAKEDIKRTWGYDLAIIEIP